MNTTISETTCLNCYTPFEGKFCPNCGQKATTHRYSVKTLKDELYDKYKPFDNKVLFTLKEILFRPVNVTNDFLAGRRVKYSSPFSLLLVVVSFTAWVTRNLEYKMMGESSEIKHLPKSVNIEDKLLAQSSDSFNDFYMQCSEYTTLFSVLFISIASYHIFRKAKLHFGEHFIVNAIATISTSLIYILFVPVMKLTNDEIYINLSMFFFGSIYYCFILVKIFQRKYNSKTRVIFYSISCLTLSYTLDSIVIIFLYASNYVVNYFTSQA